jgi:hypothetical protein
VGRGGRECRAAHLRQPPRRPRPDAVGQPPRNTCPGSPDKRPDLPGESCDRRSNSDRPHIRREAVSDPHAAGLRAAPSPALADARGVEILLPIPFAFIVAFADALLVTVGFAFSFALPVGLAFTVAFAFPDTEVLRPVGLS